MKYCMKCGVSIDEEINRVCPLCQTIILTDEEIDKLSIEEIKIIKTKKKELKKVKIIKEKKSKMGVTAFVLLVSSLSVILTLIIVDLAIEFNLNWSIIPIISVILFILTVCIPFMRLNKSFYWFITFDAVVLSIYILLLNYIINHRITWAYYVLLSIVLVWVYLTTIFVNKIKGFIFKISIGFLATAIFVLLITLGYDHRSGFSGLVLPINGLVFILTVISYMFIKTYIYNWRVIIITLAINIGLLCIGLDLLIQKSNYGQWMLQWSYWVLFILIPFTLVMMYFNNRYKINKYIEKKFHI